MKRPRIGTGGRRRTSLAPPALAQWVLAAALLLAAPLFAGPPAAAQGAAPPAEAPDVSVVREHLFLTRGPAGLQVLHLLELVNWGPRLADRVPLPVPAGAQWDQVPEPVAETEEGLVDPRPMGVGERREYALAYTLPWREPMVLRRALLYPTDELWLWAEAGSVDVRGLQLEMVGPQVIEGMEFVLYRMDRLEPHPAWQVVLDRPGARAADLPVLARGGMRGDPLEVMGQHPVPRLAVVALVLTGAAWGVWRFRTRTRRAQGAGNAAVALPGRPEEKTWAACGTGAGLEDRGRTGARVGEQEAGASGAGVLEDGTGVRAEVERLKEAIVQLDVAYHNGELDEDVYRERRAALKARVLHLMGNGGTTGP